MGKIKLSVLLTLLIITSHAAATDAKSEIGWRFGEFKDINSTKKKPKTQKEILKKMLEVQEEQLKTQKKILIVLQKRFDPQPETIIVDGKPCIANSNDECYKWIPEPEAKRYPVIAEFYSNPTVENAAKYIKWYSKHTNNALKAGVSLYMAKYQYGQNATDFNIKKSGTLGSKSESSHANYETLNKIFVKNMNKFYINVYLGRSLESDVFGLRGIYALLDEIPEIQFNLIYYNSDVKEKITKISKEYTFIKKVLDAPIETIISKNMFSINGIYMTPTIEVVIKETQEAQIMGVGKIAPSSFVSHTIRYLWLKGIIKDNAYANDSKIWDNSNLLERNMYEELGKIIDVSKYKYNNTNMYPLVPKN